MVIRENLKKLLIILKNNISVLRRNEFVYGDSRFFFSLKNVFEKKIKCLIKFKKYF